MDLNATYHDLNGKSVFITGGGSGIGASLTEGFLRQGAKVAFVGRSDASGFVDEMEQKTGNRPFFIQCDITDIPALQDAIAKSADTSCARLIIVSNTSAFSGFETFPGTFGKSGFGSACSAKSSTSENPHFSSTGQTAVAPTPCRGE